MGISLTKGNDFYLQIFGVGSTPVSGLTGNDIMRGILSNDFFLGNAGNDELYGNGGADTLYGGAGDDKVYGGAGADLIMGDTGSDLVVGGTGADTFRFNFNPAVQAREDGVDTIADFRDFGNDRIEIDNGSASELSYASLGGGDVGMYYDDKLIAEFVQTTLNSVVNNTFFV